MTQVKKAWDNAMNFWDGCFQEGILSKAQNGWEYAKSVLGDYWKTAPVEEAKTVKISKKEPESLISKEQAEKKPKIISLKDTPKNEPKIVEVDQKTLQEQLRQAIENANGAEIDQLAAQITDKTILKEILSKADANGKTPLAKALINGDLELAHSLIEHGVEPNALNGFSVYRQKTVPTPLMHKLIMDRNVQEQRILETIQWFQKEHPGKLDFNTPDAWGYSPLYSALRNGRSQVAEVILNSGTIRLNEPTQHGFTVLNHLLFNAKNINDESKLIGLVEHLMAKGADPNIYERNALHPLCYAVKHGQNELAKQLLLPNADLGKLLPELKANVGKDRDTICKTIQFIMEHAPDQTELMKQIQDTDLFSWAETGGHTEISDALMRLLEKNNPSSFVDDELNEVSPLVKYRRTKNNSIYYAITEPRLSNATLTTLEPEAGGAYARFSIPGNGTQLSSNDFHCYGKTSEERKIRFAQLLEDAIQDCEDKALDAIQLNLRPQEFEPLETALRFGFKSEGTNKQKLLNVVNQYKNYNEYIQSVKSGRRLSVFNHVDNNSIVPLVLTKQKMQNTRKIIQDILKDVPEIPKASSIEHPQPLDRHVRLFPEQTYSALNLGDATIIRQPDSTAILKKNQRAGQNGQVTINRQPLLQEARLETGSEIRVGNKSYVYTPEALHVIENADDYERFFKKPIYKAIVGQGDEGNCYLVSSMDALSHQPAGVKYLANLLKQERNGDVTALFPGFKQSPITIPKSEVETIQNTLRSEQGPTTLESDELGYHLIEHAYGKLLTKFGNEEVKYADSYTTNITGMGGRQREPLFALTGGVTKLRDISTDSLNGMLDKLAKKQDEHVLTTSTSNTLPKDADPFFQTRHAYSIRKIDPLKKKVHVVNPHDPDRVRKLSYEEFKTYFGDIESIELPHFKKPEPAMD